MTIIKDNTVLRDSLDPEDVLHDTKAAIISFIKFSQDHAVPEDVIEQTLIRMIADGFKAETIVLKGELPKDE